MPSLSVRIEGKHHCLAIVALKLLSYVDVTPCEYFISIILKVGIIRVVHIVVAICRHSQGMTPRQILRMSLQSLNHMVRKLRQFRNRNDPVNGGMKHPDLRSLGYETGGKHTKAMDRTRSDIVFN